MYNEYVVLGRAGGESITDDWRVGGYLMREWEEELRSPQLFYVLLDANKRNYSKVVDTVRGLPGVVEIHNVTGDYNILVKVYGDDVESHAMRFQKNVKDLPGVRAVKTLIPTAF